MAITNYGELRDAAASWMARSDLTNQIPDFIEGARAMIYHGGYFDGEGYNDPLRIREMLTAADLTPSSGSAALPNDFLEARRLYEDASEPFQLYYIPPEDFYVRNASNDPGISGFYTIEGSTIRFSPKAQNRIKLLYYALPAVMSADADTDPVLTKFPFIYLYSTIAEGFDYVMDHQRAGVYRSKAAALINARNKDDRTTESSGSILQMRYS
jgi:hypothetical protein